jgi:hypothetical protein
MPLKLNDYYLSDDKSILKSFNFTVTFHHDDSGNHTYLPKGILSYEKKLPEIKDYHILNLSSPMWEFKKEIMYYGPYPRTFPVLNSDGFEFSITFEDDEKGTITKLINFLQRKIIKPNGTYVAPKLNRVDQIDVQVLKSDGNLAYRFLFDNCYFLKSSPLTLDYGNNESLKYEIFFGCDFFKWKDDYVTF